MSKVPAKAKEVAVPLDMDWGSKIGLKDQYESLHPPLIKLLQGQVWACCQPPRWGPAASCLDLARDAHPQLAPPASCKHPAT